MVIRMAIFTWIRGDYYRYMYITIAAWHQHPATPLLVRANAGDFDESAGHASSAAQLHLGSSSSNSKTLNYRFNRMIQMDPCSRPIGTEKELYTLKDIVKHLKLDVNNLIAEITKERGNKEPKVINDFIAGKCLEHICSLIGLDCITSVNKAVPGMSQLSSLATSTHIIYIPDVLVCVVDGMKRVVGLTGEVLSSPMKDTELKAIYLGIDLLRLVQCEL